MFEHFENKTNAEVYHYAFRSIMMRQYPDEKCLILGNSQREHFLPFLNQILSLYKNCKECQILDIGAGSGEIVDLALQSIPHAIISIEEPNKLLLNNYLDRLQNYTHLKCGKIYHGPVQDLLLNIDGKKWLKQLPEQQVILSIHMIYHLTEFDTDVVIDDPKDSLIEMILALYGKLSVGGTLFLVYAEQLESMVGYISYEYFRQKSYVHAENIKKIWTARKHLLREGAIELIIQNRYPEARCTFNSYLTMSRIYAYDESELAVTCLTGELGTVDSERFDVEKLHFSLDIIRNRKEECDIARELEEGPRKGMISATQPQVICIIGKSEL